MIKPIYGWIFTLFVTVSCGLFMYAVYPKPLDRDGLNKLFEDVSMSEEYSARLEELIRNDTPLSVADLEIE